MALKICPRCASTNVGTSTNYKLKKGASYAADFTAGYLFGETALDVMSETGGVSDNVNIAKEYQCKDCGFKWKATDADRLTVEEIERQKRSLEARYLLTAYESKRKWIIGLILTVIGAGLVYLYIFKDSFDSYNPYDNGITFYSIISSSVFEWTSNIILMTGVIMSYGYFFKNYLPARSAAKRINKMTVSQFLNSEYRHFITNKI